MSQRANPESPLDEERLSLEEKQILLAVAREAIRARLRGSSAEAPLAAEAPAALRRRRATFVTLTRNGELRGCIGSLEAGPPLIESVWQNARKAAFEDPRFAPLEPQELDEIAIHISILSPLQALAFESEAELMARLEPGLDGLVIEADGRRATFLPSVWRSLPTAEQFLAQLRRKAGLPADRPVPGLRAWHYRAQEIDEDTVDAPCGT